MRVAKEDTRLKEAKDRYLSAFAVLDKEQAAEPAWLRDLRGEAITRFGQLGFPTTRHEEWRYTDVTPIAQLACTPSYSYRLNGSAADGIDPYLLKDLQCHRLVFVNGHYSPELSSLGDLPSGVELGNLAAAIGSNSEVVQERLARYASFENDAFTALNTAFVQDGAFIRIPDGAVIEEPILLLFIATAGETATVAHPRTLVVVGANSRATIIESYISPARDVYFTNAVMEIVADRNSLIDHYKVQVESERAFHVATMQVQQERNCNFSSHSIAFGGRIARHNANAVMGASGIECTLNGLFLAHNEQLIDNHTVMDHAQPQCNSHELYAGILADKAQGVFNGKIFVRPGAQKTDAKQTNRNLLLSREAVIDTKPQLEIFADDVRCTHGATIGQLDEDALFYLRARGIDRAQACDILTYAFASDVLNRIQVEPLRAELEKLLPTRLAQARTQDD